MRAGPVAGTVLASTNHPHGGILLSLPIRTPLGIATAVAIALVASAPAQAAPTAVEQTSATSFNYALPGAEKAFNYTLPGDDVGFHFVRKAG
jgi:hypothetical protein